MSDLRIVYTGTPSSSARLAIVDCAPVAVVSDPFGTVVRRTVVRRTVTGTPRRVTRVRTVRTASANQRAFLDALPLGFVEDNDDGTRIKRGGSKVVYAPMARTTTFYGNGVVAKRTVVAPTVVSTEPTYNATRGLSSRRTASVEEATFVDW